jgi:hypothetical protein
MNLNRDANIARIIRRVEVRLTARMRRDEYAHNILYYAENDMEIKVAQYLMDTNNMKEELFNYILNNFSK